MGFGIRKFRTMLAKRNTPAPPVILHDIEGTINDGASTFTFKLNNDSSVTVQVDGNGDWYYDVPSATTLTTLEYAFDGCSNLTRLAFGQNINTTSVTKTGYMLRGCEDLTSLDITNLDTSNVTSMTYMFDGCKSLTSVDLSNLNTQSVTTMASMFRGCESLLSVDLSNFDTQNVTNMQYMFYKCYDLQTIDIHMLNVAKVTDMSYMFNFCKSLTSINATGLTTTKLTTLRNMFDGCTSLLTADLSSFTTSSVNRAAYTFRNCNALTSLNLQNWSTARLTSPSLYSGFVPNRASLTVDYTPATFSSTIVSAFPSVNWVAHHDIEGHINDGASTFSFSLDGGLTQVTAQVDGNGNWYYDVPSATTLTTLEYAFDGRSNLTRIKFGQNFDTSNVTNMSEMFTACSSLTSVDLSSFDTSNVTDMSEMFYMCNSLTTLDLSTFRTPELYSVDNMFVSCQSLTILNLQNWDTSDVTSYYDFVDDVSTLQVDYTSSTFNTSIVSAFPNVNWVSH